MHMFSCWYQHENASAWGKEREESSHTILAGSQKSGTGSGVLSNISCHMRQDHTLQRKTVVHIH